MNVIQTARQLFKQKNGNTLVRDLCELYIDLFKVTIVVKFRFSVQATKTWSYLPLRFDVTK